MRIESVELSGWMPFAERVALVLPPGPIAIVGTHSGDPRRSNRAGKTSLLEAITWCLYGVHRKRLDDAIINSECDECSVTVQLGQMRVTRSRVRSKSTKLAVSIAPGSVFVGQAAEEAVAEYIGLGLQDYLATLCFRQGDVESIVTRTAGERLALVSEWLQQSRWIDAKRIQSAKTSAAVQEHLAKAEALAQLSGEGLSEDERKAAQLEISRLEGECSLCEEQMERLRAQVQEAERALTVVQDYEDLRSLRKQATECRDGLGEIKVLRPQVQVAENEYLRAQQDANHAKKDAESLQRVRRTGFDGTCPITCEACPAADEVTEVARAANELLKERLQESSAAGDKAIAAHAEYASLRERLTRLERQLAKYEELVRRGKELAAKLPMSEEDALNAPNAELLADEVRQLQGRYVEASRRLGEIEGLVRAADGLDRKKEQLQAERAAAEVRVRVTKLALSAIVATPARIASQQLHELEREANVLLSGTGVSLRFSWARELADKAPLCEQCGHVYKGQRGDQCPACGAARGRKTAQELELLADDGSGVEEDVRFNSGGTRAIVGSAIRLAASAMLRRLRSTQAAWAIVDEPFGSLDAENREQLARTFAGMLDSVGFEQALVVSHDPLLLGALPHRIVIDKDGSVSTARLE